MNHLMEIIKNREDKQNVIGALRKRRNISYWCVRSRVSPRDRQITARRKNTHRQRNEKQKSHRRKQTNRHGGGSMFMTPHSHLDHFYTHIHTQSSEKHAHALRTTHCLADLFKSQELCLSFPTSCSQKYLWASSVVFFLSVFCMHMHIQYIMHTCVCWITRNWHQ